MRVPMIAAAMLLASPAFAAGPISVSAFDVGTIPGTDPFKAELEAAGIGVRVDAAAITVVGDRLLTWKLIAFMDNGRPDDLRALLVDGVRYDVTPQGFDANGTLLGTQLFSGQFIDLVKYSIFDGMDEYPIDWFDGGGLFESYVRDADFGVFAGLPGELVGSVDTFYFTYGGTIGDRAIFEVSFAPIPEPASWAMMVAGFGLMGVAVRRRRAALA